MIESNFTLDKLEAISVFFEQKIGIGPKSLKGVDDKMKVQARKLKFFTNGLLGPPR